MLGRTAESFLSACGELEALAFVQGDDEDTGLEGRRWWNGVRLRVRCGWLVAKAEQ
jgi:hypothetical protein